MKSLSLLVAAALSFGLTTVLSAQWEAVHTPSRQSLFVASDGETVNVLRNRKIFRGRAMEPASWQVREISADLLAALPDGRIEAFAAKGSSVALLYGEGLDTWLLSSTDAGATWQATMLQGGQSWLHLQATTGGWLMSGAYGSLAYAPTLQDDWEVLDQRVNHPPHFTAGRGGLYARDATNARLVFSEDGGITWQPGPFLYASGLGASDLNELEFYGSADNLFALVPGTEGSDVSSQLFVTEDGESWAEAVWPTHNGAPVTWLHANGNADGLYVLASQSDAEGALTYLFVSTTDGQSWETLLVLPRDEPVFEDLAWFVDGILVHKGVAYLTSNADTAIAITLADGSFGWHASSFRNTFIADGYRLQDGDRAGWFYGPIEAPFLKPVRVPGATPPDNGYPFAWGDTFGAIGPPTDATSPYRRVYRMEDGAWVEFAELPLTAEVNFTVGNNTLYYADPAPGYLWAMDERLHLVLHDPAQPFTGAGDLLLAEKDEGLATYDPATQTWQPVMELPVAGWAGQPMGLAGDRLVIANPTGILHGPLLTSASPDTAWNWTFTPIASKQHVEVHSLADRALIELGGRGLLQLDAAGNWTMLPAPFALGATRPWASDAKSRFFLSDNVLVATGDDQIMRTTSLPTARTFIEAGEPLGGDWYRDVFMDTLYYAAPDSNWLYLRDEGGLRVFGWIWLDRSQLLTDAWFYDPQLGWLWTNVPHWPVFRRADNGQYWFLDLADATTRTFRRYRSMEQLVLPR